MNYQTAANLIKSEYAERQAAARERYIKLLDSDEALYAAEKALRAAILDGKSDGEIAALTAARDGIMARLGASPADFDPAPRCPVCGDSGYAGGRYCDCVRRRASREAGGSPTPAFTFADCDLSLFDDADRGTMDAAYSNMKIFCDKFPDTRNTNILLRGNVGTGKTCLAAAIANELGSRGWSALFMTAFAFNDACRSYHTSFESSRSETLDAMLDADLLVIDDLGTESILRNVTLEYLYTVVSERMNARRHTLITTNLSPAALSERYGERTTSRLFDRRVCLSVALTGKDLRRRGN